MFAWTAKLLEVRRSLIDASACEAAARTSEKTCVLPFVEISPALSISAKSNKIVDMSCRATLADFLPKPVLDIWPTTHVVLSTSLLSPSRGVSQHLNDI